MAIKNVKAFTTQPGEIVGLPEKTTLSNDDVFLIEDSADGNNDKKVKKSNLPTNLKTKGQLFYGIGKPRVLNLVSTDVDLKGFQGGFTDGRYGYFVPYHNGAGAAFGKVARVDLNDFSTVSVLNLVSTDADLKGFWGGFTDGRYGYFVPYYNGAYFGKVVRVYMNFGGNF